MSEIAGILNFKRDISDDVSIRKMSKIQSLNASNDCGMYLSNECNLIKNSFKDDIKKMNVYTCGESRYVILIDGEFYNLKELKIDLCGCHSCQSCTDEEIILNLYSKYGKRICQYLNGVYVIVVWDDREKELFVLRDRFGIKPLYYCFKEDNFIFASSIKTILESGKIDAVLNEEGIMELFSLGPCNSLGKTPFKDICEFEPATLMVINRNGVFKEKYWELENKEHKDSLDDTAENIRYLVKDSIKRQMDYKDDFGVLLSGGLDSSIIAKFASSFYRERTGKNLKTFSVDYENQNENFVPNDFQPNKDDYYIDLMVNELGTNHKRIILDSPDLVESLEKAMIARDCPGMADVDSSYLEFFKRVKSDASCVLSGECSDEILGGYPWYFKEELMNSGTFPWSNALNIRQKFLRKDCFKNINLIKYANEVYNLTLNNLKFEDYETNESKKHKELMYLTMNYFMKTLLDRTDRMCRYSFIDARVPFCDYRLVEYAWNIPWEMKSYKGREKGLLRYSMEGYLPNEIIYRKKSPYPKTHNPSYLEKVLKMLKDILAKEDCKITQIIDKTYLEELVNTEGKMIEKPWFGQLMMGPQLIAYFVQLEMWFERYNPKIEI